MGITRLTGFQAEAEVLGVLRAVEYREGTGLVIGLTSLQDAYKVLDALAVGQLVTVHPGLEVAVHAPAVKPAVEAGKAPPKGANGAAKAEVKAAAPEPQKPAQEPQKPAPEPPKPAEKCSEPLCECHDVPAKAEAPKAAAPKSAPVGDAPPELLKATKLVQVLTFLQDHGTTAPDALVAECERLKATVPLLSRIPNMLDRVTRTLEVMSDSGT